MKCILGSLWEEYHFLRQKALRGGYLKGTAGGGQQRTGWGWGAGKQSQACISIYNHPTQGPGKESMGSGGGISHFSTG